MVDLPANRIDRVLESIVHLTSHETVKHLQDQCRGWLEWIRQPQTVVGVVATDSLRTTACFGKVAAGLEQLFENSAVLIVPRGEEQTADIALYMTMASTPCREDDLRLVERTVYNVAGCILLMLEADVLDEVEREESAQYATEVLRAHLPNPDAFLGVATDIKEVMNLVESFRVSTQSRYQVVYPALLKGLRDSLVAVGSQIENLRRKIDQKQSEYSQFQQRCIRGENRLRIENANLLPSLAVIIERAKKQFSKDVMQLRIEYNERCSHGNLSHIGRDIEGSLSSDLRTLVDKRMAQISSEVVAWFAGEINTLNEIRRECGLSYLEIDPKSELLVPYEPLHNPSMPFPDLVESAFLRLRFMMIGLASAAVVASVLPALGLPAGLAVWLGSDWEQRKQYLHNYRQQILSWIGHAITEAEQGFRFHLDDVHEEVASVAKKIYPQLVEQTLQELNKEKQQHPTLLHLNEERNLLSSLQSLQADLANYTEIVQRLNDYNLDTVDKEVERE